MELINDSRWFEPIDVKEPELDEDGNEIEALTKEERRELLGEFLFDRSREK